MDMALGSAFLYIEKSKAEAVEWLLIGVSFLASLVALTTRLFDTSIFGFTYFLTRICECQFGFRASKPIPSTDSESALGRFYMMGPCKYVQVDYLLQKKARGKAPIPMQRLLVTMRKREIVRCCQSRNSDSTF